MKRVISLASSTALLISGFMAANVMAASHAARHVSLPHVVVQLCTSTPIGVAADRGISQGIENGASLASDQMRPILARWNVTVQAPYQLNDATADGSAYSTDVEQHNAFKCLGDSHAMGYIGTLNSAAALVSEPILNRQHMVMVSPANTSPSLTSPFPYQGAGGRRSQEPATFFHRIPWVTYYRTVTTDALQGPAGALFAHNRLHARTYFLVDDKLTYGAGLAAAFGAEAQRLGMSRVGTQHIDSSSTAAEAQTAQAIASAIVRARPDMVYCGCDAETTGPLPRDLRRLGYTKPFMGGDALFNSLWITNTAGPIGSTNNYATSVGPDAAATSYNFKQLYQRHMPGFYHNPGIQAYDAPSYDASRIVLLAILHAAQHHQLTGSLMHKRTMVVKYVRFINYYGATGHTQFDANGDTTNRILSVYGVQNRTWHFMGELRPQGFNPA